MHPNLNKNYSEKLSLKVLGKNHTLLIPRNSSNIGKIFRTGTDIAYP